MLRSPNPRYPTCRPRLFDDRDDVRERYVERATQGVHRSERRVPSPVEQVAPGLREADTAQEILKPQVGSERIEDRSQQDGRIESRLIGLVQPDHRLVVVAESGIDRGNIRGSRGALTLHKDIARIADVPIGTVMSRLARARRLLAESLGATPNISGTQVHK